MWLTTEHLVTSSYIVAKIEREDICPQVDLKINQDNLEFLEYYRSMKWSKNKKP